MDEKDRLLREAATEIRSLRNTNQQMRDRLYVFDSIMLLVRGRDSNLSGTIHPDLVYEIEKVLKASEKKEPA